MLDAFKNRNVMRCKNIHKNIFSLKSKKKIIFSVGRKTNIIIKNSVFGLSQYVRVRYLFDYQASLQLKQYN